LYPDWQKTEKTGEIENGREERSEQENSYYLSQRKAEERQWLNLA
jgi:hypothetical protein